MFRSEARAAGNIEHIGKVRNDAAGHPGKPRRARPAGAVAVLGFLPMGPAITCEACLATAPAELALSTE